MEMAFDGLFTRAVKTDLQRLTGGRISKIHQPNDYELLLHVRANRKNEKLLISIHPSYARIHTTNETIQNPKEPPMFCMRLRKEIDGGFIESIEQIENDRILTLTIQARNEIGDPITRQLVVELMGRHSNAILIDPAEQKIVDSMKHLPPFMNRYRTILPGAPYVPAPLQEKANPYNVTEEQFIDIYNQIEKDRDFIHYFLGFSPLHARELAARLREEKQSPFETFQQFLQSFETTPFHAEIVKVKDKEDYSVIPLLIADETVEIYSTIGDLLDAVYFGRAERERVKAQSLDLERWLKNEMNKLEKKKIKIEKERQQALRYETYQLYGELITANNYALTRGMEEVVLDNYYEQGTTVTVPLDPRKTPIENAQMYFKKHRKAKSALDKLGKQLIIVEQELQYFDILLQQVTQASIEDIEDIREELIERRYMRRKKKRKGTKKKKVTLSTFVSSTGLPISVGKNNKQNDFLTFRKAADDHLWFHTKDMPGSHVVLHDSNPDKQSIEEAAMLAAYFSKGRLSSAVPVDYTKIRHVKKPAGTPPGFVNYFEQQTIFVTPKETLVFQLQKKE